MVPPAPVYERRSLAVRVEAEYGAEPLSVRHARAFVAATLAAWDLDDLSEVALLLTSEVVTNAIVHARTTFRLTLELDEPDLIVEVSDGSPAEPAALAASDLGSDDAVHGRGLQLVDALAGSWGWRRAANGEKVVWFLLRAAAL